MGRVGSCTAAVPYLTLCVISHSNRIIPNSRAWDGFGTGKVHMSGITPSRRAPSFPFRLHPAGSRLSTMDPSELIDAAYFGQVCVPSCLPCKFSWLIVRAERGIIMSVRISSAPRSQPPLLMRVPAACEHPSASYAPSAHLSCRLSDGLRLAPLVRRPNGPYPVSPLTHSQLRRRVQIRLFASSASYSALADLVPVADL